MHISEKLFQKQVMELAALNGWIVNHTPTVQNKRGVWLTPTQGDIGYPDLTLSGSGRGLILAELKSHKGSLTKNQQIWHRSLRQDGADIRLWKPQDWEEILETLSKKPPKQP